MRRVCKMSDSEAPPGTRESALNRLANPISCEMIKVVLSAQLN